VPISTARGSGLLDEAVIKREASAAGKRREVTQ